MSKKTGQFYAVKMIQANKLRGHQSPNTGEPLVPDESAKWAREISILEKLCHENICQLKEVFFETSNISQCGVGFVWRIVLLIRLSQILCSST